MTPISELSPEQRHALSGLLFFAAAALLGLWLYRRLCRAPLRRRVTACGGFAAALLGLAWVMGGVPALPWLTAAVFCALSLLWAGLGLLRELRAVRGGLSPASVRQALDNLPAGILFADGSGRAVLVNHTMARLAAALLGSPPQTGPELEQALTRPPAGVTPVPDAPGLLRFPDGHVWRFRTQALTDPSLPGFTQTTAEDVTDLAETNARLTRDNAALREAVRDMRRLVDGIGSLVPQQEMLNLKIRVHNDIGASLIALTELARGGSQEATDAQVRVLWEALRYFGSAGPAGQNSFADARRRAEAMHAALYFHGERPRSRETEALIADAARECVTNCVRHAGGSRVDVTLRHAGGAWTAVIVNDGVPPAGPVTEGGGLTSLRKKIESAGGALTLAHAPRFTLTLTLPEGGTEP